MSKLKLTILFCAFFSGAMAQSFEGVLDFKKYSVSDTARYRYFVKDGNVRIEELNKQGEIVGIMLVLPKINSVRALSPERKLYMEVPHNNPPVMKGTPEIIKSKLTKKVAGVECVQWRIKNVEDQTEITYWVAKGDYNFFIPLLKTINRKDKLSYYFLSLPELADGFFPFEADERGLTREFRNMIKVDKIEKKTLDNKIFIIPADYKKYDK